MKGILCNYDYCINCHSCEVACKKYLHLPKGEYGMKVSEVGPYEMSGGTGTGKDKWEWYYVPSLTKQCNMCEDRVEKGKMPMCVQHCQGFCLYYGEVEELAKKIDDKSRWVLMTKPVK